MIWNPAKQQSRATKPFCGVHDILELSDLPRAGSPCRGRFSATKTPPKRSPRYIRRDYSAAFLPTPWPPGRDLSTPPPSIRGPEGPVPDAGTILKSLSLYPVRSGAGAVAKELIAREALERIAMQEIRAYPDCEHVTNVEIEYRLDKVLKTNWTMHVFTREGAHMARIQQAINATRHRLQHRYDLRPEA